MDNNLKYNEYECNKDYNSMEEFDFAEEYEAYECLNIRPENVSINEINDEMQILYDLTHHNTKKAMKYARNQKYKNRLKRIYSYYHTPSTDDISNGPVLKGLGRNNTEYYSRINSSDIYEKKQYKRDKKRLRNVSVLHFSKGNSFKKMKHKPPYRAIKAEMEDLYYSYSYFDDINTCEFDAEYETLFQDRVLNNFLTSENDKVYPFSA